MYFMAAEKLLIMGPDWRLLSHQNINWTLSKVILWNLTLHTLTMTFKYLDPQVFIGPNKTYAQYSD